MSRSFQSQFSVNALSFITFQLCGFAPETSGLREKKKFMRIVFLVFLCAFQSFSQSKTAKGFVYDEESKQPIPYVNISIIESTNGTSSDDNGSFELTISETDFNKQVHLSSLGYKDSIISVEKLIKSDKIFLKAKIEQLNEVVISKKFEEKFLVVNPLEESDLCAGYGTNFKNPWMLALYFPYDETYKETDFLKGVKIHFGNFRNIKSKFRLRLFSVDENGLPDEDVLKESVIVELKKNQKIADVDISNFNIIFPRNGFYIAFEWLYIPYNEEEVKFCLDKKCRKSEKRIIHKPTFSAFCDEENEFKVAIYNSGEWKYNTAKKYQSEVRYIPAFSLTLSN